MVEKHKKIVCILHHSKNVISSNSILPILRKRTKSMRWECERRICVFLGNDIAVDAEELAGANAADNRRSDGLPAQQETYAGGAQAGRSAPRYDRQHQRQFGPTRRWSQRHRYANGNCAESFAATSRSSSWKSLGVRAAWRETKTEADVR